MVPMGVLAPETEDDIVTAIDIAGQQDVPLLPRFAGTARWGQTVNAALVLDAAIYFNDVLKLDVEGRQLNCTTTIVPAES